MLDSSNWGIEWGCLSVCAIRCCFSVKRVRPFPQLERQVKHGKFCMTEGCCLQLLNKMQNDCCAPCAGPFRSFGRQKNMKERFQVKYKPKASRLKLQWNILWAGSCPKYINIEYCFNNKTKEHKNKRTSSFQVYLFLVIDGAVEEIPISSFCGALICTNERTCFLLVAA